MSSEVVEIERNQRQRDQRINGKSSKQCLHDGNERPNAVMIAECFQWFHLAYWISPSWSQRTGPGAPETDTQASKSN